MSEVELQCSGLTDWVLDDIDSSVDVTLIAPEDEVFESLGVIDDDVVPVVGGSGGIVVVVVGTLLGLDKYPFLKSTSWRGVVIRVYSSVIKT